MEKKMHTWADPTPPLPLPLPLPLHPLGRGRAGGGAHLVGLGVLGEPVGLEKRRPAPRASETPSLPDGYLAP